MKLDFLTDNAEQAQMWRFVAQAVAIRDNTDLLSLPPYKKSSIINVGVRCCAWPQRYIYKLSIETKSFTMNVPLQHRKGE